MDQRPNVSIENSSKPSKLMALIALVIAFALPFILVKLFPHKQKANYENTQPMSVPEVQKSQLETPIVVTEQKKRPDPSEHRSMVRTKPAPIKTILPPKKLSAPVEHTNELKSLQTRRRDTLAAVFSRIGLSRHLLQTINRENSRVKSITYLRPNEQLQYIINNHVLEKMIIPFSSTHSLIVFRDGKHYKTKMNAYKITTKNNYVSAVVHGSLFTTAKRHNISYKLIQQMTEIFAWDINFAKDIRANDQFTIVYKTTYANDKLISTGDIVAVTYTNRGKTFQAILHTNQSGHSDYYSPKGSSLKNAFNRYPLRFTHISSTFSLARHHPILHYKRPHKGIDLAAPIGTPIQATGDGYIEIIGRQSGYGNMIKIRHNNIYSSIYGHMLKFQKGISKGTFVRRGQVIGYVGQTGLATGPHCHYEFHVRHQRKNPTTVELPRGNAIPPREMARFKANSNTLLSQIKSYESQRFAKTTKQNTKLG